jgi:hypothetical protein
LLGSSRSAQSIKEERMPSIISRCLDRAKKSIRVADAIRVATAVLLVMGVISVSKLLTRRESVPPSPAVVRAPAAVQQAPRPQEPVTPAKETAVSVKLPSKAGAPAATPKSVAVTITGCLERRDETFRLNDTDGADAPRTRTWKTAFLKKGPAPIEVVDAANRHKLGDHVGERVNVTGTLVEREMQVHSLEPVAASCSKPPSA